MYIFADIKWNCKNQDLYSKKKRLLTDRQIDGQSDS